MSEPVKLKQPIEFCLATIGGDGSDSQRSIMTLIQSGKYEKFIAQFVNGMVHQGFHHTGHETPIGGATALRIANDFLALIRELGGDIGGFDFELFHQHVNLNKFKTEREQINVNA